MEPALCNNCSVQVKWGCALAGEDTACAMVTLTSRLVLP